MSLKTKHDDQNLYMSLIFLDILYNVNASVQGKEENLFTSSDKLNVFLKKIDVWKSKVENKAIEMFAHS